MKMLLIYFFIFYTINKTVLQDDFLTVCIYRKVKSLIINKIAKCN